ncbi:MAG: hypothetical protein ABW047_07260 [Nitrospiraceae bacterium]
MRWHLLMVLMLAGGMFPPAVLAVSDSEPLPPTRALKVISDPAGGVHATATIVFPAPLPTVQSILTDYRKWPELFEVRMRLAGLEEHAGGVMTDLYIEHSLMPGERRLLCDSHTLPTGGLVTDLKAGDFRRYHREWKLFPMEDSRRTRAEFELIVEIDTIVPDWVIAMAMRRELEAHFRIITERANDRVRQGK